MASCKIIAIIGTTGSGKTKLGVELAKTLSGEVISADSMQIYRGLDAGTAKVSREESEGIPHHCIDILDPNEEFSVHDFIQIANQLVLKLEKYVREGKLPSSLVEQSITFYHSYDETETEVHSTLLSQDVKDRIKNALDSIANFEQEEELNKEILCQNLYSLLQEVDPESATKLYYRDIRRIRRSLEILGSTGKTQSEIVKQRVIDETQLQPKYTSLIFWLHTDQPTLDRRLNDRVNSMLTSGLLDECANLRHLKPSECSQSIKAAIGYKEFDPYFDWLKKKELNENFHIQHPEIIARVLEMGETKTESNTKRRKLQSEKEDFPMTEMDQAVVELYNCVETLKSATRKYARKQIGFIKGKVIPRAISVNLKSDSERKSESQCSYQVDDIRVPIFLLDTSNALEWLPRVNVPAIGISSSFLNQTANSDSFEDGKDQSCGHDFNVYPAWAHSWVQYSITSNSVLNMNEIFFYQSKKWQKYWCELCSCELNGLREWQVHQKSRGHRKRKTRQSKAM